MKIIDRYIARAVIGGALVSLSVFAALFIFIGFVGELAYIGTYHYGLTEAIWYVLLSTPQTVYELSPSAILLGGLISLGSMAGHSELVAMRAAGITIVRLIRSVLQAGLVLVIAIIILGELIVPYTTSEASLVRAIALEKKVLAGGGDGIWAKTGNSYVNVKTVLPGRQLQDISVYELNNERELSKSTFAKLANYEQGQWQLYDVIHTEFVGEKVRASANHVETWEKLLEPDLFDVLRLKPGDMSATRLYQYSAYMESNNLDAKNYRLAFWIKIFTPITCLAMLVIAMPLVLSTTPRSGGIGQRIVIGLLVGVAFYVLNRSINYLGIVYGMAPLVSAVLPLLFVITASVLLLRRIR